MFKRNKDGSGFAVIKAFGGSVVDAIYPACRLVEGSDRAIYGVSATGGDWGNGAVFKIPRNGNPSSVVTSFNLISLGGFGPVAGLVKDTDGNLYGVTELGGDLGQGTVFKLALTSANHPPVVSNPIGPRTIAWSTQTSFAFAANTFGDADAGQILSYTATGFPGGLVFTGTTRTFSGSATNLGSQMVTVVAEDDGATNY